MTGFTITDLNRIIERDATDTTYKYALLRAASSIVGNHSPAKVEEGKAWYLTGFLVEKWMEYYYPVIDSETFIPQKSAEKEKGEGSLQLVFRSQFKQLTDHYKSHGGFKAFWRDYKRGTIISEANEICLDLAKSMWYTLTRYPMKHLGYSVTGEHYSYFDYTNRQRIPHHTKFSQETLLHGFGMFSLEDSFHETLRTFGYYVSGEYSILNKWIEFTVRADTTGAVKPQLVYQILNTSPEEERDVHDSQMFFKDMMRSQGSLECTWTGRRISNPEVLTARARARALNDMELRNCVYRGPYMGFLKKLSENKDFRFMLNLKKPDKRMKDVELVLRFAAFYHETYLKYKPSMRQFFNSDMEKYQNISNDDAKDLESAFIKSASMCRSMFGNNAFKRFYSGKEDNPNGEWEKKRFNASLYDVMMGVFSDKDKNRVFSAMDSLREGFIELMTSNQDFIDSIEISTSSKLRVTSRFDLARKMVDDVLKKYKPQPRCFTRELKEELFNNNSTCAICGQRINDLDDAAVDHIEQYWAGGKTIPENARLTHRFCNNTRSRTK